MKTKLLVCITVCAGLLAAAVVAQDKQSKLEARAKITKAEAEKIALASVPGGSIKESEIEKEHGKIIWSFEIAQKGAKSLIEVEIDAMTGDILSSEEEEDEDDEDDENGDDEDESNEDGEHEDAEDEDARP